jgi:hypothetical protein
MFHTPVHKLTNYNPRNERQAYVEIRKPDFAVSDQGTVVLFNPLTVEARAWLDNMVSFEPWQMFGRALAVDHRYAQDLYDGIINDGMTVKI